MTMSHVARSFRVSLQVEHPHLPPAEITAALGLVPWRAWQAGAPRITQRGDPLPGTYPCSYWTHRLAETEASATDELGEMLSGLLARLEEHRAFFRRVTIEGGSTMIFCGVFTDGNWDERFDYGLLGALADLKLDLRLDVHPPPPQPDAA